MVFVIKFILLFAIIGGILGLLFKGKTKEAFGDGAANGAIMGALGLLQLLAIGFLALAGIWLVMKVF
jgi:hypothetical protein